MPEILDVHAAVSASVAARYAGVSVSAIVNWRDRGYLLRDGKTRVYLPVAKDDHGQEIRDDHGRPKYRLLEVAKAEAATSKRARRVA